MSAEVGLLLKIFALLASPFIGSFLGLLAVRLPEHEEVVFGASKCRECGARLAVRDLVPIVSFLINRGRCRRCGGRIPVSYPLIEFGAVVVAAICAALFEGPLFGVSCIFGWSLLTLTATDVRAMILPNAITLPLIPAGLLVSVWLPGRPWQAHLIGAFGGGFILWALAALYERLRARAGLGMGDVKLFAAAGAWLGWLALPYVMLLASVLGLLGVLVLRLRGAAIKGHTMLPLGATLAPSIFVAWLVLFAT